MSISADEPIHILIPGDAADPRALADVPPGIVVHRGPPMHPDDLDVVDGLPVTSLARTLIDCAECLDPAELRAMWRTARRQGRLDLVAVRASRSRVEWRPTLPLVDALIAEFSR